jgi:hypothetical protein
VLPGYDTTSLDAIVNGGRYYQGNFTLAGALNVMLDKVNTTQTVEVHIQGCNGTAVVGPIVTKSALVTLEYSINVAFSDVEMATIDASKGFLLSVSNTNLPLTLRCNATFSSATITSQAIPEVLGFSQLKLPQGVYTAVSSALSYRMSAMSLRLLNSTVWDDRGGLITVGFLPRDAVKRMPTDPTEFYEWSSTLPNLYTKKNMPLGRGAHVPYIRQGIEEMKFEEFDDVVDVKQNDEKSLIFVAWKLPAVGVGSISLQLNMNVEIQTMNTLTPAKVTGWDFAELLTALDASVMVSEHRFSENPSHVKLIARAAWDFIRTPAGQAMIGHLKTLGLPLITMALA